LSGLAQAKLPAERVGHLDVMSGTNGRKNPRIVELFFLDLSAGSPKSLRPQLVNGTHQVVRDFHEGLTGMFVGGFAFGHSLLFSLRLVTGDYYSMRVIVACLSLQTSMLPPVSIFTGPVFSAIKYQRSHSLLELGHLLLDLREGCFVPPGLNQIVSQS
jgi:hypothetical protein